MPFIPDDQYTNTQQTNSLDSFDVKPNFFDESNNSDNGQSASSFTPDAEQNQSTQTTNPLLMKLQDPNISDEQKMALIKAMKSESEDKRNLFQKAVDGFENITNKTFGKAGDFLFGTTARVGGDLIGMAGTGIKDLVTGDYKKVGTKDYKKDVFTQDFEKITSNPIEAAKNAAFVALEVLPGGKITKGLKTIPGVSKIAEVTGNVVAKGVSKIKKILPPVEKVAEFLTNTKAKNFVFAKNNPELYQKMAQFADDETVVPALGEEIYKGAKNLTKIASDTWEKKQAQIINSVGNKFQAGLKELKNTMFKTFLEDGVKFSNNGVDLSSSVFSQNPTAKTVFERIGAIINEKSNKIGDILNKRVAITDVLASIPKEERNVMRVAGKIVNSFDNVLDNITGGQAKVLRESYAKTVDPARKVINSLTDAKGNFSMDKARNFVMQLASDTKFDSKNIVRKLELELKQKGLGSIGANVQAEAMGVAKKLSKLTPETGSRLKDIMFSYGLAKIPVLSAIVSPKFWGEVLSASPKSSKVLQQVGKVKSLFKEPLTQIMIQNLVKNNLKNNQEDSQ